MHGAKKPGGTLYNLVLGRAIGKGIDFNYRGVQIFYLRNKEFELALKVSYNYQILSTLSFLCVS